LLVKLAIFYLATVEQFLEFFGVILIFLQATPVTARIVYIKMMIKHSPSCLLESVVVRRFVLVQRVSHILLQSFSIHSRALAFAFLCISKIVTLTAHTSIAMVVVGKSSNLGMCKWQLTLVFSLVSSFRQGNLSHQFLVDRICRIPSQQILGETVVVHHHDVPDDIMFGVEMETVHQGSVCPHTLQRPGIVVGT
jgi:hypothetical protein